MIKLAVMALHSRDDHDHDGHDCHHDSSHSIYYGHVRGHEEDLHDRDHACAAADNDDDVDLDVVAVDD